MKYGELNLGQIEAVVNKLGGMDGVWRFLSGGSEVVIKKHLINTNADPFVPDGWKVEEQQTTGPRNTGLLEWDASKVQFYLDPDQRGRSYIQGTELRKRLVGKPVLNANVLDYLLKNPHIIPEDWKKDAQANTRYIYFWGTIYRDSLGDPCVRCLCWRHDSWNWGGSLLHLNFDSYDPAALRAS